MKKVAGIILSVVFLLSACSSVDNPPQPLAELAAPNPPGTPLPPGSWTIDHIFAVAGNIRKSHRAVVNARTNTLINALYSPEYRANSSNLNFPINPNIPVIPVTFVPVISVNSYFSINLGLPHELSKVRTTVSPGSFSCAWQLTPVQRYLNTGQIMKSYLNKGQIMNCSPSSSLSVSTSLSANTLYTITVEEYNPDEATWKETTKTSFYAQ